MSAMSPIEKQDVQISVELQQEKAQKMDEYDDEVNARPAALAAPPTSDVDTTVTVASPPPLSSSSIVSASPVPSADTPSPDKEKPPLTLAGYLKRYVSKMQGRRGKLAKRPSLSQGAWTWVLVFIAHAALMLTGILIDGKEKNRMAVGSFGALSVLLFAAPQSPFAQPWVVFGGHFLCTFIATAVRMLLRDYVEEWLLVALGVASAVTGSHALGFTHPPAAGAAFISCMVKKGSPLDDLGMWFVIYPSSLACVIFLTVAVLLNNLSAVRRYPVFWWGKWGWKYLRDSIPDSSTKKQK